MSRRKTLSENAVIAEGILAGVLLYDVDGWNLAGAMPSDLSERAAREGYEAEEIASMILDGAEPFGRIRPGEVVRFPLARFAQVASVYRKNGVLVAQVDVPEWCMHPDGYLQRRGGGQVGPPVTLGARADNLQRRDL